MISRRAWQRFAGLGLALAPMTSAKAGDHDAQLWITLQASGSIDSRLTADGEVVFRASHDQGRVYEREMTAMLGYRVSKRTRVSAGFTHAIGFRGASTDTQEKRARQQIAINLGHLGGGVLSSRSLLEQRFRQGGRETGWRARQLIRFVRPLRNGRATALVASHESFISLNTTVWGQRAGYERMRNFAGLRMAIAPMISADIGYLNQYDFRQGRADRIAHAASFTLLYTL